MTEDTTAMASGQDALGSGAVVVERVVTPRGELVLRRAQAQHEIIHNGVFLMDTRNGASERLLVRAALDACRQPRVRILIGGLGVGFSLDEALRHPAVTEVAVIEVEEAIIRWHATHFGAHASTALEDPRTRLVNADLARLQDAAASDATLATAFIRVVGMLDRPETLLRPDRVIRVLRAHRAERACPQAGISRLE